MIMTLLSIQLLAVGSVVLLQPQVMELLS